MKLSFPLPSKSSSSSRSKTLNPQRASNPDDGGDDEAPRKQYVTEFDSSKPQNPTDQPTLTIAPIPNSYRPHKRMKNLHDLPSLQSSTDDGQLQFVTETLGDSVPDSSSGVSYGLNIRSRPSAGPAAPNDDNATRPTTEDVLLDKLRVDLRELPEDRGFAEFEDMPVESFAKALLSGYGWKEGQGVGRNAKEDVKVKQYHKRTGKEGLGFSDPGIGSRNNGATPPPVPSASPAVNPYSSSRSRASRESKRDRGDDAVSVGKHVRVIGGSRRDIVGFKGTVLEVLDSNRLVLKIAKTGDRLKLNVSDIAQLGSREEEKYLKELEELRVGKVKAKSTNNGRGGTAKRDDEGDDREERGVAWLRSNIRVRVISKDLKGGKLYLKKGEVVDVVGPYMCDVSMDESRELVERVDQDFLETALPRSGGPVLVLYGKYKGVCGNLVKKDLDKEVGVVEEYGTLDRLDVKLEQIAEFVGDPSYFGY
ncbi:hypothetical protein Tsubulata_043585 [Turnera subulata]|uniref:G-patch domain-containing protein n=1 Tax=Turnera subulata TaxID=218843 RepID=A0A9Q0JMP2_9ROSI|nr:hypothetical protein Tsubulata_043585 [Turnera subulata]